MQKRFFWFLLFVVLFLPIQGFAGPASKSASSGYRKHILAGGALATGGLGVGLWLAYQKLKKAEARLLEKKSEERQNAYELAKSRVSTLLKAGGASIVMTALLALLSGGNEDALVSPSGNLANPVVGNSAVGVVGNSADQGVSREVAVVFPASPLPLPQAESVKKEVLQEIKPLDDQIKTAISKSIVSLGRNLSDTKRLLREVVAGFDGPVKVEALRVYSNLFLTDAVRWGTVNTVKYLHQLGADIKVGGGELLDKATDPAVYVYLANNGLGEYVDLAGQQIARLFLEAMQADNFSVAQDLCGLGFDVKNADQAALFEKFLLLLPHWTPDLLLDEKEYSPLKVFFNMCPLQLNTPAKQLECFKVLFSKTSLWNSDRVHQQLTSDLLRRFALDYRLDLNAVDSDGRNILMCALADESADRVYAQKVCDAILSDQEIDLFRDSKKPYGRPNSALVKLHVNHQDNDGFSALMLAVKHAQPDHVNSLLARGAQVNLKAKNGTTALSLALKKKNERLIRILRTAGATDELVSFDKSSEVIADSRSGSVESSVGMPLNSQPTASVLQGELQEIRALSADEQNLIRKCIENKELVFLDRSSRLKEMLIDLVKGYNERTKPEALRRYSDLFLVDAVNSGDFDIVKILHSYGADVEAGGKQLLDQAIDHPLVYAYLATHGLGKYVDLKSPGTSKAFLAAVSNDELTLARGLGDLGFHPGAENQVVLRKKFLDLLKLWSNSASEKNFVTASQLDLNEPQMQLECLKTLKNHWSTSRVFSSFDEAATSFVQTFKLDLNATGSDGRNVLMCAIKMREKELCTFLLAQSLLNVNHQSLLGQTALMLASLDDQLAVVDSLLARGADVDLQASDGMTALLIALKKNKDDV
ncbi:MAG: hypothetical protein QG632_160, partial [Candidatus Dependentiae bacterium]|nr:hypothetical protein [Candidatus Dependentiae bacterium]